MGHWKNNYYYNYISDNYFVSWWFIKYQITYLYKPYVVVAFLLFIAVQTILLPIYCILYVCMLLVNGLRVLYYLLQQRQSEVCPIKEFSNFENAWAQFIYNVTYRRACINSFTLLHFILKLFKDSTFNKTTLTTRLVTYFNVMLRVTLRLLWNILTGIPWFIITRSFQYSKAFCWTREWSPFDTRFIRGYIINNYQMDELFPGLDYRIYKSKSTTWNFNPK